jgi:hypothetical protein
VFGQMKIRRRAVGLGKVERSHDSHIKRPAAGPTESSTNREFGGIRATFVV